MPEDADWFVWMSFPDPHHPWDPPASEQHRCNWRDLDLPAGHPGSNEEIERVLAQKPAHWLELWKGKWINGEGGPGTYRPQNVTHDNIREINAMCHIMNEMIDEACGRVLARVAQRGWEQDTDVFFTTDHGELQGDYGLIFKGPFHTDSLMRLPMVWQPAPSAGVTPAVVREPVGQLDLAPTFCEIAGVPAPSGRKARRSRRLPVRAASACCASGTRSSPTTACTCARSTATAGCAPHTRSRRSASPTAWRNGSRKRACSAASARRARSLYDGSEGELYNVEDDPHQFANRWDDPECKSLREDLVADLYESLPKERKILEVVRPA